MPPLTLPTVLAFTLATLAAAPAVERDIVYLKRPGTEPRLTSLDLYPPAAKSRKPAPVMVILHGGGWSLGDKSNSGFVQPKTAWLNRHGLLVASVNYRLSPAVKHPAHINDVCAAIAWLQRNAARHGGDPRRIYLLGHSAGAHLAALAGVDRQRLVQAGADPASLRGVILLDGAGYDIPRQYPIASRLGLLGGMYQAAFTNDRDVQRDASPALKPIKDPPPYLILHVAARADSKTQSELLAAALRKAGGKATVTAVAGKNHITINRDCGKPGDPVTRAIAAFLGLPADEATAAAPDQGGRAH